MLGDADPSAIILPHTDRIQAQPCPPWKQTSQGRQCLLWGDACACECACESRVDASDSMIKTARYGTYSTDAKRGEQCREGNDAGKGTMQGREGNDAGKGTRCREDARRLDT